MTIPDKIEKVGDALIHHGPYNDRLYILKFPFDGKKEMVKRLTEMARTIGYSKIVGKIPETRVEEFLDKGYSVEAMVPRFFKGKDNCYFVAKYLDSARKKFNFQKLEDLRQHIKERKDTKPSTPSATPDKYEIIELNADNAADISNLYGKVFASYPFPIHKTEYINETMRDNVVYYGIYSDNVLMSVSSAEMDTESQNAEMTDFAVSNRARGLGLSKILLRRMESEMRNRGMKTLYTIARLASTPMNRTFLSSGYNFAGCLKNNTNIAGGIESMNVWYKHI